MRRTLFVLATLAIGCGDKDPAKPDGKIQPDTPISQCQPISAVGAFYRRAPNPRLIAGTHTYTDGQVDVGISDPDLRWDEASQLWHVYFHAPHAMNFGSPITGMIRHATSPDLLTWTIDETPSLVAASDVDAWDHGNTETPSVIFDAANQRYLLYYSGSNGNLPGYSFPGYSIGVATSTDGKTFTRLPAADSPHGKDGLVLTGADVFPGTSGAIVADPEIAYVGGVYHLWFSSFNCGGTNCQQVLAFGISHATSTDGIHWMTKEAPVRTLLRASIDPKSGGQQPSVIYDELHCRWEMWLTSDAAGDTDAQPVMFNNSAGVWHAISNDGVSWDASFTGMRDLAWRSTEAGEHLGLLTGADVAAKSTGRYMLYSGFDDQNVPSGFYLPSRPTGAQPGVMTMNLATRDAP
jgi:hypothetical protein